MRNDHQPVCDPGRKPPRLDPKQAFPKLGMEKSENYLGSVKNQIRTQSSKGVPCFREKPQADSKPNRLVGSLGVPCFLEKHEADLNQNRQRGSVWVGGGVRGGFRDLKVTRVARHVYITRPPHCIHDITYERNPRNIEIWSSKEPKPNPIRQRGSLGVRCFHEKHEPKPNQNHQRGYGFGSTFSQKHEPKPKPSSSSISFSKEKERARSDWEEQSPAVETG